MGKQFKLKPPMMPNFITIDIGLVDGQDMLKDQPKISISELSREEAEQYADLMKTTFIQHWEKKKIK